MGIRDEELVAEIARGDMSPLEELYNRYKRRIMTYAYYFIGNRERAEDILQETFLRVFKYADRFDPGRSFSAWVYSIAANLCRDELRRKKRRQHAIADVPFDELVPFASDSSPSPRSRASGREFAGRLREELRKLKPEQREVIVLHYLNGLKYREIARVLGCPIGTVQSRLHAGLKIVRERLKDFSK